MAALMVPVTFGGMAISIDVGVQTVARAQLMTAADAAALAGATQLANDLRISPIYTGMPGDVANAQSQATLFAQSNMVLGATPVVLSNSGNSSTGDIVVGYTDPTVSGSPFTTAVPSTMYNTVKATVFRDVNHGSPIPGFFGAVLGHKNTSSSFTSYARMESYNGVISGFQPIPGVAFASQPNSNLLPIVLYVDAYNAMIAGATTDKYTYDPATNTVSSGPDGIFESPLYPIRSGDPGNWGTIKVGVSNNSTSTLVSQILYGITPTQLATFPNSTIQLDYTQTPPQITFSGNPGISAGIKDALTSIIGKPVTIPIYDQTDGNGNNAWYRVIKFAPVRILAVNFQGNPKDVTIQPAFVNDPTAIPPPASYPPPLPPQGGMSNGGLLRIHLIR
jgi:hypothetical protein